MGYVNEFDNFQKLYIDFEEKPILSQKSTFSNNFFNQTPNYKQSRVLWNNFNSPLLNQPQASNRFFQNTRLTFCNNTRTCQHNQFNQKPVLPSQPVNVQSTQLPLRRLTTNSEIFGPA